MVQNFRLVLSKAEMILAMRDLVEHVLPKEINPHHYQFKIWALKTDKIPVDSNSSGALVGYMLNANKIATAEIIPVYEVK